MALLVLLAAVPGGLRAAEDAPVDPTSVVTNVYQIPKAVFLPEGQGGLDPFFPTAQVATNAAAQVPTHTPDELAERYVVLRGITGQAGNKVALINNQTFEVGDTNTVKLLGMNARLEIILIGIVDERTIRIRPVEGKKEHVKQLTD